MTLLRIANHVLAQVALGRQRLVAAKQLHVAGIEGGGKKLELGAGVVDVELALHFVAGRLQHVGQGIAQHCVACAAVVDRAGRVGADKFDLPALAAATLDVAKRVAGLHDGCHLLLQPGIGEANVDKARTGHLDRTHRAARRNVVGNGLGNLARRHSGRARLLPTCG